MQIGIITTHSGFGPLRRWAAAWVVKGGGRRVVVEGPILPEGISPGQEMSCKLEFAQALGMAIIENPPQDGE